MSVGQPSTSLQALLPRGLRQAWYVTKVCCWPPRADVPCPNSGSLFAVPGVPCRGQHFSQLGAATQDAQPSAARQLAGCRDQRGRWLPRRAQVHRLHHISADGYAIRLRLLPLLAWCHARPLLTSRCSSWRSLVRRRTIKYTRVEGAGHSWTPSRHSRHDGTSGRLFFALCTGHADKPMGLKVFGTIFSRKTVTSHVTLLVCGLVSVTVSATSHS